MSTTYNLQSWHEVFEIAPISTDEEVLPETNKLHDTFDDAFCMTNCSHVA